jgi:hypothetical protein
MQINKWANLRNKWSFKRISVFATSEKVEDFTIPFSKEQSHHVTVLQQ